MIVEVLLRVLEFTGMTLLRYSRPSLTPHPEETIATLKSKHAEQRDHEAASKAKKAVL